MRRPASGSPLRSTRWDELRLSWSPCTSHALSSAIFVPDRKQGLVSAVIVSLGEGRPGLRWV